MTDFTISPSLLSLALVSKTMYQFVYAHVFNFSTLKFYSDAAFSAFVHRMTTDPILIRFRHIKGMWFLARRGGDTRHLLRGFAVHRMFNVSQLDFDFGRRTLEVHCTWQEAIDLASDLRRHPGFDRYSLLHADIPTLIAMQSADRSQRTSLRFSMAPEQPYAIGAGWGGW